MLRLFIMHLEKQKKLILLHFIGNIEVDMAKQLVLTGPVTASKVDTYVLVRENNKSMNF